MSTEPFFVVSRYNENLDWLPYYAKMGVIYDKGVVPLADSLILEDFLINKVDNVGGNQRDIFKFATDFYDALPDLIVFLQGYPFDHCNINIFNIRIKSQSFTPLEYYGKYPANSYEGRTHDGGFLEINNNWYIHAHNASNNQNCKYASFDEFMMDYFANYHHLDWIRFSPGSQYIVEKKQILQYPRSFWESVMNLLNSKSPTEGHIVERALYYIFTGEYKLR